MRVIGRRGAAVVLGLASIGAVGTVYMAPAIACSGISTLSVTPRLAPPGAELRVVAEGVGSSAKADAVELWWVGEGGRNRSMLATAIPAADGRLDTVVEAPAGAAVGSYLIKLRTPGGTEDQQANALVKVVDSPLPSSGPLAQAASTDARPLTTGGAFESSTRSSATSVVTLVPLGVLGLALVGSATVVLARQPRRRLTSPQRAGATDSAPGSSS